MKHLGAALVVAASYAVVIVILWKGFSGWWAVWPILASCAGLSAFTSKN